MFHRAGQLAERESERKGACSSREEAECLPLDGLWQAGIVKANYEFVRARLGQSIAWINDRKARVISMIDEGLSERTVAEGSLIGYASQVGQCKDDSERVAQVAPFDRLAPSELGKVDCSVVNRLAIQERNERPQFNVGRAEEAA